MLLFSFTLFYTSATGQLDYLPEYPTAGMCYLSVVTPVELKSKTVSYPIYLGTDLTNEGLEKIKVIYEPAYTIFEYQKAKDEKSIIVCPNVHAEVSEEMIVVKKPKKTDLPFHWHEFKIQEIIEQGGVRKWEEIPCEYLDYSSIPVEYTGLEVSLNESSMEAIDDYILDWMREKSLVPIEILARYDDKEEIAMKRAEVIKDYLVQNKIKPSSILLSTSFTKKRPYDRKDWQGIAFRILN